MSCLSHSFTTYATHSLFCLVQFADGMAAGHDIYLKQRQLQMSPDRAVVVMVVQVHYTPSILLHLVLIGSSSCCHGMVNVIAGRKELC